MAMSIWLNELGWWLDVIHCEVEGKGSMCLRVEFQ